MRLTSFTRGFRRVSLPLLAAACTAAPAPVQSPSPSAPATHPASGTPADTSRAAVRSDAEFLQHMIHHHAQALVMTALVPARTGRADIRMMAERIDVSQRDEIRQMQALLRGRGEEVPAVDLSHPGHGMGAHAGMPGMLTPAEMERLTAARGAAFDRLFLELMIRHHEGALTMVEQLFATPGAGQDSRIFAIASEIDSDQRMEIARMRSMLAASASQGAFR